MRYTFTILLCLWVAGTACSTKSFHRDKKPATHRLSTKENAYYLYIFDKETAAFGKDLADIRILKINKILTHNLHDTCSNDVVFIGFNTNAKSHYGSAISDITSLLNRQAVRFSIKRNSSTVYDFFRTPIFHWYVSGGSFDGVENVSVFRNGKMYSSEEDALKDVRFLINSGEYSSIAFIANAAAYRVYGDTTPRMASEWRELTSLADAKNIFLYLQASPAE